MLSKISAVIDRGLVVHPFLLAIYPILFLWNSNKQELSATNYAVDVLVPLVISVALTAVLVGVAGLVLRNWKKAGLLAAFYVVLFFSYGHIQQGIADSGIFGYPNHRYMVLVWAAIAVSGSALLILLRANLRFPTNFLNVVTIVLVVFALANVGGEDPLRASDFEVDDDARAAVSGDSTLDLENLPDIYYLVLEGYTSNFGLLEITDYDNTPFTDYLSKMGFYVVPEGYSNYSNTETSVWSSLNMEHHESSYRPEIYRPEALDNKAFKFAREHGYRIIYLREKFTPKGKLPGDDLYFGCDKGGRVSLHGDSYIAALLHTTALEPVLRRFAYLSEKSKDVRICDFSQIAKSKDLDGPKLVYIHTLIPGEPYVIDANGETVTPKEADEHPIQAYLDQVTITNKMLKPVIDILLSDPDYSPVIILQGDHGQLDIGEEWRRGSTGILHAFFMPNGGDSVLYPTITPVNSFRTIFNYYLGADFPLLADDIFFISKRADPRFGTTGRQFIPFTDLVRPTPKN
jgi:hypothetical protein